MRIQDTSGGAERGRPEPRKCTLRGCRKTTAGTKPYCLEHVEQNPYMRTVAQRLQERQGEVERILRGGVAGSALSLEIVRVLEFAGPLTPRQLGVEIGLRLPVVRRLLQVLVRQGLVQVRAGRVSVNDRSRPTDAA